MRIDIDFHLLYGINDEGIKMWDTSLSDIIQCFNIIHKDEHSEKMAKYLRSADISEDSQISTLLLLLNSILRPTKVKKDFKPTILFAQEDTIIFVESDSDSRSKVDAVYSVYETWSAPSIVKLVFLAPNTLTLSGRYYVVYKHLIYQVDSVARAIDVLVKMTHLGWSFHE
ncbi:uncharacterized protein LOC131691095 [Topomyia yanbarensis]|uniref:uncharacterized protein LOC131691095 n=1 Tax=Topomyia yanbarensis TaxID=2498891 RepID=UPI00273A9322|nr:uncharacterized protein LOC131691095 [Topomyia yanbarensis]XP_058833279.1 uncharacterized protein LOC131691095 [Topomyia yanbarensis]